MLVYVTRQRSCYYRQSSTPTFLASAFSIIIMTCAYGSVTQSDLGN